MENNFYSSENSTKMPCVFVWVSSLFRQASSSEFDERQIRLALSVNAEFRFLFDNILKTQVNRARTVHQITHECRAPGLIKHRVLSRRANSLPNHLATPEGICWSLNPDFKKDLIGHSLVFIRPASPENVHIFVKLLECIDVKMALYQWNEREFHLELHFFF